MNDEKHNNNFTYYRVTSDIVKKYSIGACSHQSSVIFTYFLENLHLLKSKENDFPKIDVMYIHNGNHVFIVLGRNIDSDPSDYKNWGPDALVLDPWANKIYPASQIEQELFDFITVNNNTGKAEITLFDPNTQTIQLLVSSIFSPREFTENYPQNSLRKQKITSLLESFHKAASSKAQKKIANTILQEFNRVEPDLLRPVEKMLYSQMDFFLKNENASNSQ
ncbi:MAG: hypothetical protein Tsb0015_02920 [Simkaniaceae bacterium]